MGALRIYSRRGEQIGSQCREILIFTLFFGRIFNFQLAKAENYISAKFS